MLTLTNIDLQFSDHIIFENLNFSLFAGQKMGLVGRNGAGKSTLFSIVKGELEPDKGEIDLSGRLLTVSLEQEITNLDQIALEYVIAGHAEVGALRAKIRECEKNEDYDTLADAYQSLDELRAYDIESQASEILNGLGFSQDDMAKPIKAFSGGWRVRLSLARCLLAPSDFLLLDEPSNHLDLDALIWLERWIQRYPGSMLLISHDRDFLDHTTNYTLAIENKQAALYKGNYSSYEKQRSEKAALQQKSYEKQQKKREHVESFVNRFRAKSSKAKQVQSRVKMLSKLPNIALAQAESGYSFEFLGCKGASNPLIRMEKVEFAYEDNLIYDKLKFGLNKDDRIGLLGLNGAGKSTLVKLITGELKPDSGKRHVCSGFNPGYFAQHQLEALSADESVLRHLEKIAPGLKESELRRYLGGFNFQGNRVFQNVETLSGGEKARLALALIIWKRPNVLLLDEPTNHLDIEMREALTFALQGFTGALVLVSHDRHLLQTSVDEYVLVDDGRAEYFDGDLSDYEKWLSKKRAS